MQIKKILCIFLLGFIFIPQLVSADGGFFLDNNHYMTETDQKAAILFDKNKETLVVSTSFSGDAQNFSWILPTPSQPKITKVSKDIFSNLETLTMPEINQIMPVASYDLTTEGRGAGVEILEETNIGYYDITVLKSDDKNALFNWLKDNDYTYPEKGKYILDDYIRLGWTFTAIKIDKNALGDSIVTDNLYSGNLSPLKLEFSTNNIVFPLKISGISQYDTNTKNKEIYQGTSIDLYIFADHKQTIDNFNTDYANWIKPNDINNLATDEQGETWVNTNNKFYLTKLSAYLQANKMDEDLYSQDANNNQKVGVAPWWQETIYNLKGNIFWILIVSLLMFFIPIYWQFKKSRNTCRIFCWISQSLSFIFKLFLMSIVSTALFDTIHTTFSIGTPTFLTSNWPDWYYFSTILLFTYALPIGMLIIMILELIYQRKK